jgi:hypothetical protein
LDLTRMGFSQYARELTSLDVSEFTACFHTI